MLRLFGSRDSETDNQTFLTADAVSLSNAQLYLDNFASDSGYDMYLQLSFAPTDAPVSVIPLPAAAWLLGSGLGLLGWMCRKT